MIQYGLGFACGRVSVAAAVLTVVPYVELAMNADLSPPESSSPELPTLVSRPGKRMPRPRDIWIFDEVVLFGRTQRDVARELGMTQPRISQIVNTMIAWLARQLNHEPTAQPAQDWRLFIPRLAHLRSQAEAAGRVPATNDPARVVERALVELLGLNS